MNNREKVIKGLECCTFILGKRKCNECPYQKDNGCYQLQDDFHVLLKEQEAVEGIIEETRSEWPDETLPVSRNKEREYPCDPPRRNKA